MVEVQDLAVRVGQFELSGISFALPPGQYGVLMGRTGCGKTTMLEAICGLKKVQAGRVLLQGRDVTHLPASRRGVGFVPQDHTLFSTKTVRRHLSFGPSIQGWSRAATARRVEELAHELGISHLLDRKPHGLSGGERQRVSLGRALAARPGILCLDEPLSSLDEETQEEMLALIRRITRAHRITSLHVTHSRREAGMIADRIFRIEGGRISTEITSRSQE